MSVLPISFPAVGSVRFTKPNISKLTLPPGRNDLIVFDEALPNFGIRLRGGGKRTWIVQYRIGAKQRRITLGPTLVMDLDVARAAARNVLARVGLLEDPQAEKDRARAAADLTLGLIVDRFLAAKRGRIRDKSIREAERYLRRHWVRLHKESITSIGRADIAPQLRRLATENGPVAADRARAALSSFFSWAMREGLVEHNPVSLTNRPAVPQPRERVLSDSEIVEVWNVCRDDDFGRIIRLLLLTGQREDEVGSIRWSELDLDAATWSLSGRRTKNNLQHIIPISDPVLAIIESVPRREGRDLIFGLGSGGFSGLSGAKKALDARILATRRSALDRGQNSQSIEPIPHWVIHDLRRTAVTGMGELGVPPHVIEATVNHISGIKAGVAGVYNRAQHLPERRQALSMWGEHIVGLIDRSNSTVIPMHRA